MPGPNIRACWFARTRLTHARAHILSFFYGNCPRVWEITEVYDRTQNSLSSSQLIFPINICLCAEEQAAVRLMIRITAACRPATPAACWEDQFPSRAAICHPCPSVNPLPSRTSVSHRRAIEGLLSSNDRRLTLPLFLFLLCHLALLQLDSTHFLKHRTLVHPLFRLPLTHTHTHTSVPPPPSLEDEVA